MQYTRRSIYLIILLFIGTTAFSQKVEDQLVEEMCECVTDMENPEAWELELGLCMMTSINGREKAIKKEMGIDVSNFENFEAFGEKIGVKLAIHCPEFIKLMAEVMEEDEEFTEKVIEKTNQRSDMVEAPVVASKSIDGTLNSTDHSEFSVLNVTSDNGRKLKLYWMGYFEGSDELPKFKNKDVTISYKDMEVYSHEMKDYKMIKVITKIAAK